MTKKLLIVILICISYVQSFAQIDFSDIITNNLNNYLINNLQEKVFVETNLEQFDIGDTIWFKATITDAIKHLPAVDEKMFYIDLVSPENKVVYHQVYNIFAGFAGGYLPIKDDFSYGSYKLIAYTNFMKNYPKEYFFQKDIEIIKPLKNEYEWEFTTKVNETEKGDSVQITFHVQSAKNSTINSDANLKFQLGQGTVWGTETRIVNNIARFESFIPDSLRTPEAIMSINAPFLNGQMEKIKIELSAVQPEIQFTPEGGSLISNINNVIAVKSTSDKGSPLLLSGKIYDEDDEFVCAFDTKMNGMGKFNLFPSDSSVYYAQIQYKNESFRYNFPKVDTNGYSIKLVEDKKDTLIFVIVKASEKSEFLSIMGHTRGISRYYVNGNIPKHETYLYVPKNKFHTGVAVFTLFAKNFPVAERMVYIDRNDQLNIDIVTDKHQYNDREKVDVSVKITDRQGNPVQGSFCMNAYDKTFVGKNQLESNIQNYLLITSDLNGTIDNLEANILKNSYRREEYIDLLMMNNSWSRFEWKDIYSNIETKKQFSKEKALKLTGNLKRASNGKSVPKNIEVTISLFQGLPIYSDNTFTDENGNFEFTLPEFSDSAKLVIQTKNRLNRKKDFIIDISTSLEKKNLSHLSFDKIATLPLAPIVDVASNFMDMEEGLVKATINKQDRIDNYYFPGQDTFLIEEVEVNSDFLSRRDSMIHLAGEPDVVIESAQLKKLTEENSWYSNIWDLLANQIPGLLITEMPYNPKIVDKYNLVIYDPEIVARYDQIGSQTGEDGSVGGIDAIYFRVADNPTGRLNIIVDDQALSGTNNNLYDFLSYMDPSNIESVNFIAKPKDYEAVIDDKGMTDNSLSTTYNDETTEHTLDNSTGAEVLEEMFEDMGRFERLLAPPSYLFITTKSKKGIFYEDTKGVKDLYLSGFSSFKEFQSPSYAKNTYIKSKADRRKTLFWEPNVLTDAEGKAQFSFFTSDSKNPFDITVQGINLKGQTGYHKLSLNEFNQIKPLAETDNKEEKVEYDYQDLNVVAGKIIDKKSKKPISAVDIYQAKPYYHQRTNNEGEFWIELQSLDKKAELQITAMGFKSKTIKLSGFKKNKEQVIELEAAEIAPVSTSESSKSILRKALRESIMLYGDDHVFSGYFRETVAVNDDFYSINESNFTYSNNGKAFRPSATLFETEKLKKMEDKNGHRVLILKPNHRSSFYPLKADALTYAPTFLDASYFESYEYELVGTIEYDNQECFYISFTPKDELIQSLDEGTILIDKDTYAIRNVRWEHSPKNRHYLSYTRYLQSNPLDYKLKILASSFESSYAFIDGKLVLMSAKEMLDVLVNGKDKLQFDKTLSLNSERNKSEKHINNSVLEDLIKEVKTKQFIVKDAEYQIKPWIRYGIVKPESYLIRDARFMHDIVQYR